jgi:hypothetical protein
MWVVEATGLVDLSTWPQGARLIHAASADPVRNCASPTSTATASSASSPTPIGQLPELDYATAATPASKTGYNAKDTGLRTCLTAAWPGTGPTDRTRRTGQQQGRKSLLLTTRNDTTQDQQIRSKITIQSA